MIEKLQRDLECVNLTINQLKEEAEATKECFEAEKAHWIDEKEKVIRYQKQLQLNYVQVRKMFFNRHYLNITIFLDLCFETNIFNLFLDVQKK